MKNKVSMSDVERYVDGECEPREAERIAAVLENDPTLRRRADRLRKLDLLLRSNLRDVNAPKALRDAVAHQTYAAAPVHVSNRNGERIHTRRGFLVGAGGMLAASLAAAVIVPRLIVLNKANRDVVDTFFHDFETYLLKDEAVDISDSSFGSLTDWYRERLSFSLPTVDSSRTADVNLIGGRLCWLLERRMASLSFAATDGGLVLYVMEADGLALPAGEGDWELGESLSSHRSAGNASLIWRANHKVLVMVGTYEIDRLKTIARSLLG